MAFVERKIDLVFIPAQNATTPGSSTEATTVSGLWVQAHIEKAGAFATGNAAVTVYGMQLSLMNQFSSLGQFPSLLQPNTLIINAGDVGSPLSTVFEGTIQTAWVDASDPSNVAFRIEAFSYAVAAVSPGSNKSYAGAIDLATVMANIATEMNLSFENNGVSVVSYNPVFQGSMQDQANACARQGGFNWIADIGILAIWPRSGARQGEAATVSIDTGLQGVPTYQSYGIQITTLLNVGIQFGRLINVQSEFAPTSVASSGTWAVNALAYDLSTLPGGHWHMEISGYRPGAVPGAAF